MKRRLLLLPFLLVLLVLAGMLGGGLLSRKLDNQSKWMAWKSERIAKGDSFEWKTLVPPEVPDSLNFAQAPLVAGAILEEKRMDPRFKSLELPAVEAWGNWREGRRVDLKAYETALQETDLLKALRIHAVTLSELEEASLRPSCRIPIDYTQHQMPALLGFRAAGRTLCLRALVLQSRGRNAEALADIQTCLRMTNHFRSEPSIVSSTLRLSLTGMALQVIWEGLLDHRYSLAELEAIEDLLRNADLLAPAKRALEGERLIQAEMFTCLAEGLPFPNDRNPAPKPPESSSLKRTWYYGNLLVLDKFSTGSFLDAIDPGTHRIDPEARVSHAVWHARQKYHPELRLARNSALNMDWHLLRLAQLQTGLDQARIACALERFRLTHGNYPGELRELMPRYLQSLPREVINGDDYRYRKGKTTCSLYSVGWDLQDGGGDKAWKVVEEKHMMDPEKGDWPWIMNLP